MKKKIISSNKLFHEKRWKTDYFLYEPITTFSSKYESKSLRELARERKEYLDPQKFPKRTFNYLGLENIESSSGDLIDFQPKIGSDILSRSKIYFEGDVLYSFVPNEQFLDIKKYLELNLEEEELLNEIMEMTKEEKTE